MRDLQLQLINDRSTARRFQLLAIIEREQFVTTQYIAAQLGVSQRTILTDIQLLKDHFGESAAFDASNTGYQFAELDITTYNQKKQTLLDNEPIYEIISNIFYGELDTLEDTANYLNYSPGSLRRILQSAQSVLRQYGLIFQMNPIQIVGEEIAIRKFFFDFYYEGSQTTHTLHPPKGFQQLFLQLSEEAKNIELDTAVGIASFYYRIYIAFERYRQGFRVALPESLETIICQENDFEKLSHLIATLGKTYDYSLPKTEVAAIHFDILTQRTVRAIDSEILFYARFGIWPEIETIAKQYVTSFTDSSWDQATLLTFYKSFFLSIKIKEAISPILNKTMSDTIKSIRTNQTNAFYQNVSFIEEYAAQLQLSTKYREDIATSLTMYADLLSHFYAAKKQIYFILEGDSLTRQSIISKATQFFGKQHQLTFISIWDLSKERLQEASIDLIVTNYSPYITDYVATNPYVLINAIPKAKDWQTICIHLGLDPSYFFA
ncbi:helix-turn-helix domain-containing protein [Enterococcus sp. RIT-PI-f]|uniref:helix-turn-helix domain-containing protein n=1 Tax=Enterococcus sp. RIT-PI-f TaxID=1690244 RepID=UPI0006B99F36|nr:helix-turn-helix domain-containing protein [Enterococcus sp. RIT-PI-f]KPG71556.1 hypothetical protein AEQ18_05170 [Enterococcus sp. RIT-PI-f]